MDQGGNYWTLFTPGIWKVLHAVLHTARIAMARDKTSLEFPPNF
jgi:hypothetical protein